MEEQAKQLQDEAAVIRKKEGQVPPAGCRLDMLTNYLERAEKRQVKAAEAVTAAGQQLEEAKRLQEEAAKNVEDSKARLATLRAKLASGPADLEAAAAAAAADMQAVAVGEQASDALARARTAVEGAGAAPLMLSVFRLPDALGSSVFAGRAAPALEAPLDPGTAFLQQDALQSRVRDAALAGARLAAAASSATAPTIDSTQAA